MGRRNIHRIKIVEVEYVAHQLAKELMEWNEPIPEFNTRFPQVLESCLATPFQTFQRKSLYKGLIEKSAILFYLMIKNHPFQNGNKRVAVTALLYFLDQNGKWIKATNTMIYTIAKNVAASDPAEKTSVIKSIQEFLTDTIVEANSV